jgi:hypothetical protein
LELNFVPVYHAVVPQRGTKAGVIGKTGLSFFVGLKSGAGRWFFDIFIQGSKKVQL